MPVLTVLIAPLLALYLKYRVIQFTVRIMLFATVYVLFKESMQFIINTVMGRMNGLDLPCMTAYILNSLDIFNMINFGLSLWGTIYIGRFLTNSLMRLV